MKLIVGLGNYGKEYENTRHNIGFMCIDYCLNKLSLTTKSKLNGLYAETTISNEKVIFLKPLSFMNLSGSVVYNYANYYKISTDDIFVLYDDISFESGNFKIKKSGSSAGHHGIENVLEILKTEDIKRMRIGISKKNCILRNYVLGNISVEDRKKIDFAISTSYNVIMDFCHNVDFEKIMSKYN